MWDGDLLHIDAKLCFNVQYDPKTMKLTFSLSFERICSSDRGGNDTERHCKRFLIKNIGDGYGVKCCTRPNCQQVQRYRRHQNESQSSFSYNTKNG